MTRQTFENGIIESRSTAQLCVGDRGFDFARIGCQIGCQLYMVIKRQVEILAAFAGRFCKTATLCRSHRKLPPMTGYFAENSFLRTAKIVNDMAKTSLTIDVPEALIEQFRQRQISDKQIEAIVLAALEIWLAQEPTSSGAFGESAVPFVRRMIAQNRTLFETLAQR